MTREDVLRHLISETGLSMKAFAEKAGIPYTTLYSILERGVGKASIDNVIKICKALGITVEDLEKAAETGDLALVKKDKISFMTIAAHFEGKKFSEEEQKEIENFIQYVLSKRKK